MKITQQELDSLKRVRNYFGEHDITPFEHAAYKILDDLFKKLQDQRLRNCVDDVLPDDKDSMKEHYKYAIDEIAKWPDWKRKAFLCLDDSK